ncbi:MAG TPA: CDP-alcohol phosphatidyltransferase family protein [Terriglobia bacterium]|jgi:cardiolipin synthase
MLGQFFYPSNQLTLLRLVFIPFVILSILYGQYRAAFLLVLIAGISDGMDGLLARRLGQQTTLGRYLDPIADKLLLNSAIVALAVAQQIPLWLMILVLSRDVIIVTTSLVMILTTDRRLFPPSLYGKATTAAQVSTVLLTLLALLLPSGVLHWLQQAGIYSTAALTVVSGLQYAWLTAEGLRGTEPAIEQRHSSPEREPDL